MFPFSVSGRVFMHKNNFSWITGPLLCPVGFQQASLKSDRLSRSFSQDLSNSETNSVFLN